MKFAPVRRTLAILAVSASSIAATAPVPSDPAALPAMLGKSATHLTFVSLGGDRRPLAVPGRPTVVIAFASWCEACAREMPRTLADYEKYRGRVTFLGIDYSDPPPVAKQLVGKYGIPFPVESYVPGALTASKPARQTLTIPDNLTPQQLEGLRNKLPDALYQKAVAVYQARSLMTPEHFHAYEAWMGVYLADPKTVAAKMAAQKRAAPPLGLPHTFVIDAGGVVADVLEGYLPSVDRVALALAKLGVR
ncbi:MAG TPA: TlpA disulfide reductase family protein [Candidatus Tumulicola sp.]|nr:TlpA disulfide reductase family protein [Candidatus Tumulicola sp.]